MMETKKKSSLKGLQNFDKNPATYARTSSLVKDIQKILKRYIRPLKQHSG